MGDVVVFVDDLKSNYAFSYCRICHEEELQSCKSLEAPCACSGTIKVKKKLVFSTKKKKKERGKRACSISLFLWVCFNPGNIKQGCNLFCFFFFFMWVCFNLAFQFVFHNKISSFFCFLVFSLHTGIVYRGGVTRRATPPVKYASRFVSEFWVLSFFFNVLFFLL